MGTPERIKGELFVSDTKRVYAAKPSRAQLNQVAPIELPEAWLTKNAISKKSLAAIKRFFETATKRFPMTDIYTNKPETVTGTMQIGNGMTGDRGTYRIPIDVTFSRNGKSKVKGIWPEEAEWLDSAGYTVGEGYSQEEIDVAKDTYRLIHNSLRLKRAFEEIAEAQIQDMVDRDPAVKDLFAKFNGKGQLYFNPLQYFGDFDTLSEVMKDQIRRFDQSGYLSLQRSHGCLKGS